MEPNPKHEGPSLKEGYLYLEWNRKEVSYRKRKEHNYKRTTSRGGKMASMQADSGQICLGLQLFWVFSIRARSVATSGGRLDALGFRTISFLWASQPLASHHSSSQFPYSQHQHVLTSARSWFAPFLYTSSIATSSCT